MSTFPHKLVQFFIKIWYYGKQSKKKATKEFTPEEKLSQNNQGFVKGRELNTAGEKDFGKTIKKVAKRRLSHNSDK